MFNRAHSAAIAVAALVVASTAAYAAGYFPGFPILGSATFCQGVSNYSTSVTVPGTLPTPNACNSSVPAGPTALTGTEVIPMDTGYANGVSPQTILMPSTWLHAGYYQIVASGSTVTVGAGIQNLILNIAATGMTVTLPAAPYDNQTVTISNVSTVISTFAVSANTGQTLVQNAAPTNLAAQAANTAATAQSQIAYLYQASTLKWYRVE